MRSVITLIRQYWIEICILLLVFCNIFVFVVPCDLLFVGVIIAQIIRAGKYINAFICIVFLSTIFRTLLKGKYGIDGLGALPTLIGFILLFSDIRCSFRILMKRFAPLSLIILYCLLSCISGSIPEEESFSHWIILLTEGLTMFIVFSIIFLKDDVRYDMLALYSCIWATLFLVIVIQINHLSTASSLESIAFYRDQVSLYMYDTTNTKGDTLVHYQVFGYVIMIGISIFYMFSDKIKDWGLMVFCIIYSTIFVALVGARQYIIIAVFLFVLNFILKSKKIVLNTLIVSSLILVVLSFGILDLFSDLFQKVSDEGVLEGSGRLILVEKAWSDFSNNMIFGVGFGSLRLGNSYYFPHNMFIEILASLGLIGFMFLSVMVLRERDIWKNIFTEKYKRYIFPLIFLLARSIISQPFEVNIAIFSLFYALPFTLRNEKVHCNNPS